MITFVLVVLLSMEPFPTYGRLGGFDTMKACRTFIAEQVKPEHRKSMDCWVLVKGRILEA